MATQLAPRLAPEQISPPRVHWSCVAVAEDPFISLCGELLTGQRLADQTGICSACLDLAPAHAATCEQCATWVATVRA